MDATRSFKYWLEDKDWIKKVLIGGAVSLIPVAGQALAWGYCLRQFKNETDGRELPLPEWDDWAGDIKRGIVVFLGVLAYLVPVIILSIISGIFGLFIPRAVVGTVLSGGGAGLALISFCICGIGIIQALYYIALAIWLPAALLSFIQVGSFMGFFKFADIWGIIKNNTKNYISLMLVVIAASIIGGLVFGIGWVLITSSVSGIGAMVASRLFGIILLIIGAFPLFAASLVIVNSLGQFAASISGSPIGSGPVTPASDTTFTIPQ